MARTPFPIIPALCAVAIGYKNEEMVADQVLPMVTVPAREFYYLDFRSIDIFTVPELEVGRKSAPNEVEFGAERLLNNVKDYGLRDRIPQADIDAAAKAPYPYDPEARSAEAMMKLVKLGREVRTARLVFNKATYSDKLQTIFDKNTCFANPDTDPIGVISQALDQPLMRPNVLHFGRSAWTTLRQHPKVVKACNGSFAGDAGLASRQAVAELFEVSKIVVGSGWVNVARKGQKPQRVRVWGGHMSAFYQDASVSNAEGGATFGYTAHYGQAWGGSQPDKDIGPQGGVEVRVGETLREMVVFNEGAYFFGNITGVDPI
jgi:hypothetical protein